MARAYTIATVALALEAPTKWIDNVLSHFSLPGVEQGTQGVPRRITATGVLQLSVVRSLVESLDLPIKSAVRAAATLVSGGELQLGENLVLALGSDREAARMESRLEFAVEAAPLPKRGRPVTKTKRGV